MQVLIFAERSRAHSDGYSKAYSKLEIVMVEYIRTTHVMLSDAFPALVQFTPRSVTFARLLMQLGRLFTQPSRPIYRATGEQSLRVQICCIGVCTRDGARKTTKSQYRSKPSARGQQRLSLRSRDAKCQGSRNKLKMISSPVSGGQQRAADPDNPWIRVQRLLDPRDSIQARLDAVPR